MGEIWNWKNVHLISAVLNETSVLFKNVIKNDVTELVEKMLNFWSIV